MCYIGPIFNKIEESKMKIHVLGVCGTFMGGIAVIAKQMGHEVTGSDKGCYPPMSTQLEEQGLSLYNGYNAQDIIDIQPDLVIIGNALGRGNEAVEYVINNKIPYFSKNYRVSNFKVIVGQERTANFANL